MSYINERVAYLRGLTEGMKIDDATNEGKLIVKIIDVLDDVAEAIDELEIAQSEMDEYLENMDEDLNEVEEALFGEEDELLIEIECPHCHEIIFFDEDMLDVEEFVCPNCNKAIDADALDKLIEEN